MKNQIFETISSFKVEIPSNYWRSKYSNLLGSNKPTGIKEVYFIKILSEVFGQDCLSFLEEQGALNLGYNGSFITSDLLKDRLPKGLVFGSFDKKDKLPLDDDCKRLVPVLGVINSKVFSSFKLLNSVWNHSNGILMFK